MAISSDTSSEVPLSDPPAVIHIGAVSHEHNRHPYAIRGCIKFAFRDDTGVAMKKVRIESLTPSSNMGSGAIELFFHGRWKHVMSQLKIRDVVHVECALITPSDDVGIHPFHIHLHDPPPGNRLISTCIFLLKQDMAPYKFATPDTLEKGLLTAPPKVLTRFASIKIPWQPELAVSPSATQSRRTSGVSSKREHNYTDITSLLDLQYPHCNTKANTFGVVIDCRAACTTNGGQLRSEIVIADESCVMPDGQLQTLPIHCFENRPADAIPFRSIGDIVRVHRVLITEYHPHGEPTIRQGRLKYYSTVLIWQHDGDFNPIASRDPVEVSNFAPPAHQDYTLQTYGKRRILELRKWTRDYIFGQYKCIRPYVRTVSQVRKAQDDEAIFSKSFDLVCFVKQAQISGSAGGITMTVSGGSADSYSKVLLVSSEEPRKTRASLEKYKFVDFCPSWHVRPREASWALLRDVRVLLRNGERVIQLAVGARTSTIIWNCSRAPDVRAVIETGGYGRLSQSGATENEGSQRMFAGDSVRDHLGGGTIGSTMKRARWSSSAARDNEEHEDRSQDIRLRDGSSIGIGRKLRRVSDNVRSGTQETEKGEKSGSKIESSGIVLAEHESIVTSHALPTRKVWRIEHMVRTFRLGGSANNVFRLAVWARRVVWPQQLWNACRPLCGSCEGSVLMMGARCDGCGGKKKRWELILKLILEERGDGGRIEGWVIGTEAERFVGMSGCDLKSNASLCETLRSRLRTVTAAPHVVDCLAIPYEYEDGRGVYKVACFLKGTRLLPAFTHRS